VSELVAGIDGGQSSTVAVVGNASGRILARGTAGPADEIGAGEGSTRLRDALRDALADACRRAQLPKASRFGVIVAGISGYDGRVCGRAPKLPSARLLLMHDTPIAHAGALGGRAGVVVIAGTGSVVYARNDQGWSCTLGGWGFLFGDEGSAFRIACDALAMLMRAQDEGDSSLGAEARAACEFFGTTSLRRLAHAFYKGKMTRDRLASFAPSAMRFDTFRAVAYRGADRLAALTRAAIAAGAPARVSFVGGVFADAGFRARLSDGILAAYADAEIAEPRYEPACGALLLAYRELGLDVTELHR
jgi:N-acetylglucosamine kinase-like BadF-type ATPase